MTRIPATSDSAPRRDLLVCLIALAFPTLITWIYFVLLAGNPLMQTAYGVGKVLQFALPVVWVLAVQRAMPKPTWGPRWGVVWGLLFGLAAGGALVGLWYGLLSHLPELTALPAALDEKVLQFGVATPVRFLGLAVFYSLFHSLLEEYYWRWFVFGQLKRWLPLGPAIAISSLGFMAHHVLVLWAYVPVGPWLAVGSLAVAVGGAFWAWLYYRTGSLVGPWLSHLLVDAGIMLTGYVILFTA